MSESEDRLSAELEQTRDEDGEWSDEAVDIEVRPSATQVVSFRMPLGELETALTVAKASGETLSEFIRNSIARRLAPAPSLPAAQIRSGVASGFFIFQVSTSLADASWNEGVEAHREGIPENASLAG